jgi:hypothetical protein
MENKKSTIEVVLDIFSGESNPRWVLSETQTDELKSKLSGSLLSGTPKTPPQLGYRGYLIRNLSKASVIPDEILVYGGVLTFFDRKHGTATYKDLNHIEAWLISQTQKTGYDRLISDDLQRLHP